MDLILTVVKLTANPATLIPYQLSSYTVCNVVN